MYISSFAMQDCIAEVNDTTASSSFEKKKKNTHKPLPTISPSWSKMSLRNVHFYIQRFPWTTKQNTDKSTENDESQMK